MDIKVAVDQKLFFENLIDIDIIIEGKLGSH